MGKYAEVAGDGGGNYIISVGKVTWQLFSGSFFYTLLYSALFYPPKMLVRPRSFLHFGRCGMVFSRWILFEFLNEPKLPLFLEFVSLLS